MSGRADGDRVIELNAAQQTRLKNNLQGKRGVALQAAGTTFHMSYRPPFFGSVRRMVAAAGGMLNVAHMTRSFALGQVNTIWNWVVVGVSVCFLIGCWIVFRSGAEVTWAQGAPRVHRKASEQEVGVPAVIKFDEDDPNTIVVDGQRCHAARTDVAVLQSLLTQRDAVTSNSLTG